VGKQDRVRARVMAVSYRGRRGESRDRKRVQERAALGRHDLRAAGCQARTHGQPPFR